MLPEARHTRERHRALLRVSRSDPIRPLWALAIAVWFGLCSGLFELGLTLAQKPVFDSSPGFFRMNRHIVWTIPAVNLALSGSCGVVIALVVRFRPSLTARSAVAAPAFLGILTLFLALPWLHITACFILASVVSFRLSGRIARHLAVLERLVLYTGPPLAAVIAGLVALPLAAHLLQNRFAGDQPVANRADPGRAANVVLVVLDTVRADHLSLGGYARDTSPNLARFARSGIVFEQARSTAPWTLPSHASMMTGRWPHELSTTINSPLDGTHTTLAEYLATNGYATAGFVANNAYTGAETGLARGFARYEDHPLSFEDIVWTSAFGRRIALMGLHPPDPRTGFSPIDYHRKTAAEVVDSTLRWIDEVKRRPFFAFLNIYDAHDPYLPPAGFDRHFGVKPESAADIVTLNRWFLLDKKRVSARETQLIRDAYDDCIAYIDEQLGRLFDGLDRAGLLENTLVIVTADHGEHLGEHDLYGHASSLYDAEIHVPLVMRLPRRKQAGRSISAPVSLRDLAATVVDAANVGYSPFPGRSLARYWSKSGTTADLTEPTFSEVDGPVNATPNQGRSPVFRGPLYAIAERNQVYIRDNNGTEELFDVESDPVQLHNLASRPESQPSLERHRAAFTRIVEHGAGQNDRVSRSLTLR